MAEVILQRPDMLSISEATEHMCLSRSTIYSYTKRHQLLALKTEKLHRLPNWQFDGAVKPLHEMPQLVARAYGNTWDLYRVLTAPQII